MPLQISPQQNRIAIIGAGPAGLNGRPKCSRTMVCYVDVYDAMRVLGRKNSWMAGKAVLHEEHTHAEPYADSSRANGARREQIEPLLERIHATDCAVDTGSGIATFVGLFRPRVPSDMESRTVVAAWLASAARGGRAIPSAPSLVRLEGGWRFALCNPQSPFPNPDKTTSHLD